ncbi:MAG: YibE/F family protein [Patescibacteria group bacterium]
MTKKLTLTVLLLAALFVPSTSLQAQQLAPDTETLQKAKVLSVGTESIEAAPGTSVPRKTQEITAEILSGVEKEKQVSFVNDFTQLKKHDVFYLRHTTSPTEGKDYYTVADPYRLDVLLALLALFNVLTIWVGGRQGIRGLLSLTGSLILIVYVLLPGIAAGYSPMLVAIGTASLVIIAGSYITHGVNRTTTAAVIGMIITVVLTGIAAWYAVSLAHLSGYSSEEITYVYFNFNGTIDLVGLLLGGILIGLLGVLYDSAIGQAVAVEELMRAGEHLSGREIFNRAMRLGREHIGALVNTLAIAYVGAALPLLLLFSKTSAPIGYLLNAEILSTEIIRILIGSIGLILAVPITTFITVVALSKYGLPERKDALHRHSH